MFEFLRWHRHLAHGIEKVYLIAGGTPVPRLGGGLREQSPYVGDRSATGSTWGLHAKALQIQVGEIMTPQVLGS